jgi:hypothetical protein
MSHHTPSITYSRLFLRRRCRLCVARSLTLPAPTLRRPNLLLCHPVESLPAITPSASTCISEVLLVSTLQVSNPAPSLRNGAHQSSVSPLPFLTSPFISLSLCRVLQLVMARATLARATLLTNLLLFQPCPLYVLDTLNTFNPYQCVHPTRLAVVYERAARLHHRERKCI